MPEIPRNPEIPVGLAVEVYWNLHKHVFSVRDRSTGRVIGHCDQVYLANAVFRVSEAGRQRVLREKRKNVHAFVRGSITAPARNRFLGDYDLASYNPYKGPDFTDEAGKPLAGAHFVWLSTAPGVAPGKGLVWFQHGLDKTAAA